MKGAGRMGGHRGRETRRRARVRTCWSTAGAGKADLTVRVHGAEREKGTCGGNGSTLANRALETDRERERERAGEVTGADRLGPLVRGGMRARGTGSGGLVWAEMAFSFFSGFSNSFSISLSIGFSNPNSN
jgi:hypothetical protein